MATGTSPLAGSQGSGASQDSSVQKPSAGANPLAQEQTFLKLLVAQIRNQNPLNPADGIQFVSQLAQFSELEQVMQMQSDLGAIRDRIAPAQSSGSDEQTTDGTQGG